MTKPISPSLMDLAQLCVPMAQVCGIGTRPQRGIQQNTQPWRKSNRRTAVRHDFPDPRLARHGRHGQHAQIVANAPWLPARAAGGKTSFCSPLSCPVSPVQEKRMRFVSGKALLLLNSPKNSILARDGAPPTKKTRAVDGARGSQAHPEHLRRTRRTRERLGSLQRTVALPGPLARTRTAETRPTTQGLSL